MTNHLKRIPVFALAVALCGMAFSTACSPDAVAVSVDGLVIAANTAVTWLGQTDKVSPGEAQVLAGYVRSASVAAQQTITEWHSKDATVDKIAAIKGYWDGVVLPSLDQLPPDQALLFAAIDTAVQEVLLDISSRSNVPAQSQSFVARSKPHKQSKKKARSASVVKAEAQAVQAKAEKILHK